MKVNLLTLLTQAIAALAAAACSSTRNQILDKKIAQETEVTSRKGLQAQADKLIENNKELSPEQKLRLEALRSSISNRMDEISGKSLKLRSVLIEEVLSPNYSIFEVDLIKRRLKKLEDERLSVMFEGVDKANNILGRQAFKHSRVMWELLDSREIERN